MDKRIIKETCGTIISRLINGDDAHLSVVLPLGDINLHRLGTVIVVMSYRDGVTTPTGVEYFPTACMDILEKRVLALMTEYWSNSASPIVKLTDMASFSRSMCSLSSLFIEPALRQLYIDTVTKAGLDPSDEEASYDNRYDFGGMYMENGVLYVTIADGEESVHKACDISPDVFDCIVELLANSDLC